MSPIVRVACFVPRPVSTYDFTAFCVGYRVSEVPRDVLVVLFALFSAVNPSADCFPLNVVQSVLERYPSVEPSAFAMEMVRFDDRAPPPERGPVVLTVLAFVTGVNPRASCLPLKMLQSVLERYPFVEPSALAMERTLPEKVIGEEAEVILFAYAVSQFEMLLVEVETTPFVRVTMPEESPMVRPAKVGEEPVEMD